MSEVSGSELAPCAAAVAAAVVLLRDEQHFGVFFIRTPR